MWVVDVHERYEVGNYICDMEFSVEIVVQCVCGLLVYI